MLWGSRALITESNTRSGHSHQMLEMVVCLSDTGRHEIDGRIYGFKRGRTFFLPAMVPHLVLGSAEDPAEIAYVCFDLRIDAEHFTPAICQIISDLSKNRHYSSGEYGCSCVGNLETSDELQSEIVRHSPLSQYMAGILLSKLILNHSRSLSFHSNLESGGSSAKIASLCAWIGANIGSALTLEEAARRAGMSRSLLTRQFRKCTGMSLVEYMLSMRIGRAVKLLTSTDRSIDDIAAECGFDNIGHFYRIFRRHTNSTPRRLRNFITETGRLPLK